jgi:intracellular sulfur oxidation DsrE/DsrF family protein
MRSLLLATILIAPLAVAGPDAFSTGPLIKGYGEQAAVTMTPAARKQLQAVPAFKIAFDVGAPAEAGKINRHFNALARFLNMHVANGVDAERIDLALVVHGKAAFDLMTDAARQASSLAANPNADLLRQLQANRVQVILCGQTAAYYGISQDQLLPGIDISLSAMTSHALLQQQGYSLNPF